MLCFLKYTAPGLPQPYVDDIKALCWDACQNNDQCNCDGECEAADIALAYINEQLSIVAAANRRSLFISAGCIAGGM